MAHESEYSDINEVLELVEKAQNAEQEQRDRANEAKTFLTERDGQWDDYAIAKLDGRFRGTFDMCTPIVDGIAGEIEQADFSIRVSPKGSSSSKETAKTLDGLIRNIRNISNAEDVFNKSARSNIIGGFDCWEVVQDWVDSDSFDQDLFIKKIPNAVNSVWFDLSSTEQDRHDANYAFKLAAIPSEEFEERFKDESPVSVGDNARRTSSSNSFNNKEVVTIGKFYYRKTKKITLVMMNNGAVYRDTEDFRSTLDELAGQGISIALNKDGNEKTRTRDSKVVYTRLFSGDKWLAEEEETVFNFIPLIPIYGNFDIIDNKCIYFGKLENLFDSQRVLNYALSRDIEDGALSPAPAIWMTDEQAEGNDYSRMNTDRNPVRIYNTDQTAPPPFNLGGVQISNGLQQTIANTQQMIGASSNTFQAQQGNANAQQSGIAGLQQIEQGNVANIKWFKALEVAICHTGRVIVNAIPNVYDSTRQVRILQEGGESDIKSINKQIFDNKSRKVITLNDLSVGEYDVVCEMGPAFNSSQKEAARSFETMASINPEFARSGMDIWLKNKKEPGMDLMAERFREQLFNAGLIPQSQWNDKEKQKVAEQQAQAAQQSQQADPNMMIAQAELQKAQAEQLNAQVKQSQTELDAQVKIEQAKIEQQKINLERQKLDLDAQKFIKGQDDKFNVDAAKINQGQQKLKQDQQRIDLQYQKQQLDAITKQVQLQQQELNDAFNNLKVMREAIGADTIVGKVNTEAYIDQAKIVDDKQEEVN